MVVCVCNQFILAPRGKLQQMDVLQTNRTFCVEKFDKKNLYIKKLVNELIIYIRTLFYFLFKNPHHEIIY